MKRSTKAIVALLILSGLTISSRYYLLPKLISEDSSSLFSGVLVWIENLSKLPWIGTLADVIGIGSFVFGVVLVFSEILISTIERQSEDPFLLIRDSSRVFPSLGNINQISLEHRKIPIPYYNRDYQVSLVEQIYNRLFQSNHLILLGDGGVGKSREMGEVAQLLIREGYTAILLLPYGDPILKKLDFWPSGWPRSNLLILIDDLHLLYKQKASLKPSPREPFLARFIPSRTISFDERFREFLESVEKVVPDYKLIATVRSNTEEWGQMNSSKSFLWKTVSANVFTIPTFTTKNTENFLKSMIESKIVPVKKENISAISAKEKFGSPRNIIRNLIFALSHKRTLTSENYIPTLDGSLSTILDETERKHPILRDFLGVIWHSTANSFPLSYNFILLLTSAVRRRWLIRSELKPAEQVLKHLITRQLIKRNGQLLAIDDSLLDVSKDCLDEKQFSTALSRTSVFSFPMKYADVEARTNYPMVLSSTIVTIFDVLKILIKTMTLGIISMFNSTNERNSELYQAIKRKIPILWKIQLIQSGVINIIAVFMYFVPRTIIMYVFGSGAKAQQYFKDNTNKLSIRIYKRRRHIIENIDLSQEERGYEEEKLIQWEKDLNRTSAQIDAEVNMDDGDFEIAESILWALETDEFKNTFQRWVSYRVLGYALVFQQKWEESLTIFDKCISLYRQSSPNAISPMIGKAYALFHLGKSKEAKDLINFNQQRGRIPFINWYDRMALVGIDLALGKQEEAIKQLKALRKNFNFAAVVSSMPETKRMRHLLAEKLAIPNLVPGATIYPRVQNSLVSYVIYFLGRSGPSIIPLLLFLPQSPQQYGWINTLVEAFFVGTASLLIPFQFKKTRDLYFDHKATFVAIEKDRLSISRSERRKLEKYTIRFNDVLSANEHFSTPNRITIYSKSGVTINIISREFQRYNQLREQLYSEIHFHQIYQTTWEKTKWLYPFLPFVFLVYPSWATAFVAFMGLMLGFSFAISDMPSGTSRGKFIRGNILPIIYSLILMAISVYLFLL